MVILRHPIVEGRLDLLVVDADGHCAHTFSESGAAGLGRGTPFADHGPLPTGPIVSGTLAACWDDLGRVCIVASDERGRAHLKVVRSSGHVDADWTPIGASVSLPG
jgi:hypothetical protein